MKRENNFDLVRERVLERAGDAGDDAAAAFDKLVEEKLLPYVIFYRVSHPIVREVSSCFVLGVPLPCLGSS